MALSPYLSTIFSVYKTIRSRKDCATAASNKEIFYYIFATR